MNECMAWCKQRLYFILYMQEEQNKYRSPLNSRNIGKNQLTIRSIKTICSGLTHSKSRPYILCQKSTKQFKDIQTVITGYISVRQLQKSRLAFIGYSKYGGLVNPQHSYVNRHHIDSSAQDQSNSHMKLGYAKQLDVNQKIQNKKIDLLPNKSQNFYMKKPKYFRSRKKESVTCMLERSKSNKNQEQISSAKTMRKARSIQNYLKGTHSETKKYHQSRGKSFNDKIMQIQPTKNTQQTQKLTESRQQSEPDQNLKKPQESTIINQLKLAVKKMSMHINNSRLNSQESHEQESIQEIKIQEQKKSPKQTQSRTSQKIYEQNPEEQIIPQIKGELDKQQQHQLRGEQKADQKTNTQQQQIKELDRQQYQSEQKENSKARQKRGQQKLQEPEEIGCENKLQEHLFASDCQQQSNNRQKSGLQKSKVSLDRNKYEKQSENETEVLKNSSREDNIQVCSNDQQNNKGLVADDSKNLTTALNGLSQNSKQANKSLNYFSKKEKQYECGNQPQYLIQLSEILSQSDSENICESGQINPVHFIQMNSFVSRSSRLQRENQLNTIQTSLAESNLLLIPDQIPTNTEIDSKQESDQSLWSNILHESINNPETDD